LWSHLYQYTYKEVAKKLLPNIFFSLAKEYQMVLEEYLVDHAKHFIEQIRRNNWISLFEEKLLTEVSEILKALMIIFIKILNDLNFIDQAKR
jgi:hypothetical protein